MNVSVRINSGRPSRLSLRSGASIGSALKKLNLKPDLYIAVLKGAIVPVDEQLSDGDSVELLEVASGG